MITFDIKNIAFNLKEMKITVFYKFSNNEEQAINLSADSSIEEILKLGQEKCRWFEQREIRIEEIKKELLETILTE